LVTRQEDCASKLCGKGVLDNEYISKCYFGHDIFLIYIKMCHLPSTQIFVTFERSCRAASINTSVNFGRSCRARQRVGHWS